MDLKKDKFWIVDSIMRDVALLIIIVIQIAILAKL